MCCPECKCPLFIWGQRTCEGASPRFLFVCEVCWDGYQVSTRKVSQVSFEPFYLEEPKPDDCTYETEEHPRDEDGS